MRPVALTIAGSDSGGGAGIQADLRVFSQFGVFGTTAVTAVTAQNPNHVREVSPLQASSVVHQVRSIFEEYSVNAVKTGMLWASEVVRAVADLANVEGFPPLVVDPVMVSTSGETLLKPEALKAYEEQLLLRATLITPNVPEANVLMGSKIKNSTDMEGAAIELSRRFGCSTLVKGGHLEGDPVDVLWHDGEMYRWSHPRIGKQPFHGTGCMLSAALTGLLAKNVSIVDSCKRAISFVVESLQEPVQVGENIFLPDIERVEV